MSTSQIEYFKSKIVEYFKSAKSKFFSNESNNSSEEQNVPKESFSYTILPKTQEIIDKIENGKILSLNEIIDSIKSVLVLDKKITKRTRLFDIDVFLYINIIL